MERPSQAARKNARLGLTTLFVAALLPRSALPPPALTVCPHCPLKTLGQAISEAAPGALITIKPGRYAETGLIIAKPVRIQGEGEVVLDGENKSQTLLKIQADGVSIRGLTLMNSGNSYIEELAGIRVAYSKDCAIEGNRFVNTTFGVYIERSQSCRIAGNRFVGGAKDDTTGGNGIHSWNGGKLVIENNVISGHRDGIYLEFTSDSKVTSNEVRECLRYGLHFMSSNNNEYVDNLFTDNGAGVAVMYSRKILMLRNRFFANTGNSAYGLLLKEIHDSQVRDNQFSENTVGIFMEGSNRSAFTRNRFSSNGWALRIMADCEDNEFMANSFVENTFDVATNSEMSPNRFHENYWDQYDGYDLDHDGLGDNPFRPVSLSAVILERIDSSFILINSPLFRLFDDIERALPELIPEPLKDEHPRMKPLKEPH